MFFHPLQRIEEAAGPLSHKLLQRLQSPALSFALLPLLPSLGHGGADALGQVLAFLPADANGLANLPHFWCTNVLTRSVFSRESFASNPNPSCIVCGSSSTSGRVMAKLRRDSAILVFFLSASFFFFMPNPQSICKKSLFDEPKFRLQ